MLLVPCASSPHPVQLQSGGKTCGPVPMRTSSSCSPDAVLVNVFLYGPFWEAASTPFPGDKTRRAATPTTERLLARISLLPSMPDAVLPVSAQARHHTPRGRLAEAVMQRPPGPVSNGEGAQASVVVVSTRRMESARAVRRADICGVFLPCTQ